MSSDPLRIDYPGFQSAAEKPGEKPPEGGARRRGFSARFARILGWVTGLVLLALLPFFTLVRTSVYLFQRYPLTGWVALGGGALVTVLLLLLYLALVSLRLGGKGRVPKTLRRGTALMVGAYCLYALIYLSSANAKTEEIRETYSALNPILRVAVSTLLLADREGVLTDTGRTREDYDRWGLAVNESSLHLPQTDGYVYAVDVRTVGRPGWQNQAVSIYFRAMGFQTIRHVGTADHLHVGLPLNATAS